MKARLTGPAKQVAKDVNGNSVYEWRTALDGKKMRVLKELALDAGDEIEHPDAWQLCLQIHRVPGQEYKQYFAEPADDECRAMIERIRPTQQPKETEKPDDDVDSETL